MFESCWAHQPSLWFWAKVVHHSSAREADAASVDLTPLRATVGKPISSDLRPSLTSSPQTIEWYETAWHSFKKSATTCPADPKQHFEQSSGVESWIQRA